MSSQNFDVKRFLTYFPTIFPPNIPSNIHLSPMQPENSQFQMGSFVDVSVLVRKSIRTLLILVSIRNIRYEVCIQSSLIVNTNNYIKWKIYNSSRLKIGSGVLKSSPSWCYEILVWSNHYNRVAGIEIKLIKAVSYVHHSTIFKKLLCNPNGAISSKIFK